MEEEIIFAVRESPQGGYEGRALSAPIFVEVESLEELCTVLQEAVERHFVESERPSTIRLDVVLKASAAEPALQPRRLGTAAGQVTLAPDFDAAVPDFDDYR